MLPGRWPIERRRLPSNDTAMELQQIVLKALLDFEKEMRDSKGVDLKHMLLTIATGKMKEQPFPKKMIEELRSNLRTALNKAGHGDGLPEADDVEQAFEVRLIQALLGAFEDPDAQFCQWWAVGVWLGSMKRKLPRGTAIF